VLLVMQVFIKEQGINHWIVVPLIILMTDMSSRGRSLFLDVEWRYIVCLGGVVVINFIRRIEYRDVNRMAVSIDV